MKKDSYDLIVIGAGPGGYVAAIRASQLGLKTVIIEKEHLGGICLNWGCIPTKALLRSGDIYRHICEAQRYGLSVANASYDMQKIVERSRGVAAQLNKGVRHLLNKNKVDIIEGTASFKQTKANVHTIAIDTEDNTSLITAKNVIIATGARARELPGTQADGKLVWTYKHALQAKAAPKTLLVVGSGAIGIEFSSFFNVFGTKVTIVEMQDRILPVEDKEISSHAAREFKKQGMDILTSAVIKDIVRDDKSVKTTIESKSKTQIIETDAVLCAIGIVGNVENIGLDNTAIKVSKNHIETDEYCQTSLAGVYAIGDVAGAPWLAHKAEHEGIMVVEKIAGKKVSPINGLLIPGCTYSHPQIASIGLSEEGAKSAGHQIKVGKFPFSANGKAIALGETQGFIKTVFDAKNGELLGAHMIGAEVTELIHGYSIASSLETTEYELMHTVFPHPTLSEMLHESVLDAFERAIHI